MLQLRVDVARAAAEDAGIALKDVDGLIYVEARLQLRGVCGERQVPDARIALASCNAGIISTHYVAVLARG